MTIEKPNLTPLVEATKHHFIDAVNNVSLEHPKVVFYLPHVPEVEKWALILVRSHPEADIETVLLGVWLHDIGNLIGDREIDHAVRSETEARRFLTENGADNCKIDAVAHCVRAHRNKDVPPLTIEAKILAAADSASHMTLSTYITPGYLDRSSALAKLERDYRDIGLISELKEKLTPLYEAWKNLINAVSAVNNENNHF